MQIGRYEIVAELGRGAMGIVYRARDPKIGREIAIKTIRIAERADPSESERLRERLIREAQSAGRLSHPTIVTIYDVAEEDDVAYIAMEFVEGKTLENMMEDGEVTDADFVCSLLTATAAGLDYAHDRGIIHRDIKPANIIVTPERFPKITDFGIARIGSSKFTQTGTVMGTPSYMSPEQIRGESIDGRSDQFSLGVIAYELLAGEKPFQGDSLPSLMFKIVSGEFPPPQEINPKLTESLNQVIRKALSTGREERFPSCKALAEAVTGACGELTDKTLRLPIRPAPQADAEAETVVETPPRPAGAETTAEADQPSPQSGRPPETAPAPLPLPSSRRLREEPAEEASKPASRWKLVAGAAAVALLAAAGLVVTTNPALLDSASALFGTGSGVTPAETPEASSSAQTAQGAAAEQTPAAGGADDEPVAEAAPEASAGASAEGGTGAEETVAEVQPEPQRPSRPPPPRTTELRLTSNQPGALVQIDGKENLSCRTPCSLEVRRGSHSVTVTMEGYRTIYRNFEAGSAARELSLELQPLTATLLVSSVPPDADIFINGEKQPQKTNARLKLRAGEYTVRVAKEGAGEAQQTFRLGADELRTARFVLAPE